MKRSAGTVGWIAALGLVLSTSVQCEVAAPDLPVVEWTKGTLSLEDFKGQVTVLIFFNDASG
jgi:peroxiredoxin